LVTSEYFRFFELYQYQHAAVVVVVVVMCMRAWVHVESLITYIKMFVSGIDKDIHFLSRLQQGNLS
jgi:hypothetical protein